MPLISDNLINHSKLLYEKCLELFPETHRREYGMLMSQLFRDQLKKTQRQASVIGFIRFWLKTLADVGANSVSEHFYERKQKLMEFKNKFDILVKLHVAELVCGLLALIVSFLSFQFGMTIFMVTVASATIIGAAVASLLDKKWRKWV